jgi:hypothetical protein
MVSQNVLMLTRKNFIMRREEAKWLSGALKDMHPKLVSPMLDLGSSTRQFRRKIKPYIHEYIFKHLLEKRVDVTHFDMKDALRSSQKAECCS